MPEPRTHNYGPGRRHWGHDVSISTITDGGQKLRVSGWGNDGTVIREGDYLLLDKGGHRSTRYQVATIEHLMDPDDMWHADLVFAPRTYASQAETDAAP